MGLLLQLDKQPCRSLAEWVKFPLFPRPEEIEVQYLILDLRKLMDVKSM